MKRQEIWDWAIEAYDPPGVLTAFKMRRAVEHLKGLDVAPKLEHPPIMVRPDVWKALQEMDEEMEKASGATSLGRD
jgi:hypothetical protein